MLRTSHGPLCGLIGFEDGRSSRRPRCVDSRSGQLLNVVRALIRWISRTVVPRAGAGRHEGAHITCDDVGARHGSRIRAVRVEAKRLRSDGDEPVNQERELLS